MKQLAAVPPKMCERAKREEKTSSLHDTKVNFLSSQSPKNSEAGKSPCSSPCSRAVCPCSGRRGNREVIWSDSGVSGFLRPFSILSDFVVYLF